MGGVGLPLALLAAMFAAEQPPVADCAQSAVGPTPVRSERDVRFGRFRLLGARSLADEPRASFRRDAEGRYRASKVPATLPPGRRATLRVARADRGDASLMYAQGGARGSDSHYPRFRISDGRQAERFRACAERPTVWPGYLVARGPRCIRLEARVDGGEWMRRRVAFGRGTCG